MAPLSRVSLITRVGFDPLGTAYAAGSSIVDGIATASVDTSNFEGTLWIASLIQGGTSAAGNTFAIRQSTAVIVERSSGGQGTPFSPVVSATLGTASSATEEAVVIDVYRPRRVGTANFLFGQWTVASSCAVLGHAFAIQYEPRQIGNTTAAGTIPQSTAAGLGLTGGVTLAVSPSS